jgi:hypothetical protein
MSIRSHSILFLVATSLAACGSGTVPNSGSNVTKKGYQKINLGAPSPRLDRVDQARLGRAFHRLLMGGGVTVSRTKSA